MLDENQIKIRAKRYLDKGIFAKQKEKKFVSFFLNNSKNSFDVAKLLHETSTNKKLKDELGYSDFDGFLWVINSSYYSMFYMARALLENEGVSLKAEESIHLVTFDALVYYFYLTGKLEKRLVEDYKSEVLNLLGREKAKELIEDYFYEKRKRGEFTYELGKIAIMNKAQTSLERAKRFNLEIRKILR